MARLTDEDIQRIAAWRVRMAELDEQREASEAFLGSKEALPPAAAPEFDEDEERPLTAQGRAALARRKVSGG